MLSRLRWGIRRYVLIEGLALVLVVLGGAFWCSLAIDYWLEPEIGTRQAMLFTVGCAVFLAVAWFVVLRLLRSLQARSLALVLERRFPELNDRLIYAVELSESRETLHSLTSAMQLRAAEEAAVMTGHLELSQVFNTRPVARAIGLAVGLVISIVGFRIAQADVFQTWMHRSLWFTDDLYRRDTDLRIYVLADPGERVVEFEDRLYKHPRGSDLTILAEVPAGKKIPDRAQFRFRNVGARGGGGDYLTKIGQRQFRLKLQGLYQSIDLNLRAGDFSTRSPLRIQVVEPPQIARLELNVLYPEYTGLNARNAAGQPERKSVPVLGSKVELPAGTDLLLAATANKPLRSVRIQTDKYEIGLERGAATATVTTPASVGVAEQSHRLEFEQPLLPEEGTLFRLPAVLAAVANPDLLKDGKVCLPLPLEPETVLRVTLHDADDIITAEPIRLTIHSRADEPPQVATRLKGIGSSITRQATIPVVGETHDPQDPSKIYGVTDDYGIADAYFSYKLDKKKPEDPDPEFVAVPFSSPPAGGKTLVLSEKFKVLPLDLAVGQQLTLKVVAADSDNLTGPHLTSGAVFNFKIVSDDELLALVAIKELNIRRRFEQILEEVRNTRKDLLLGRTRLDEVRGLRSKSDAETVQKLLEIDGAVALVVERATNGIRKNANETQSIEQEFGDIRDELENNAVPDVRPLMERINGGIISPLHSINTLDYNNLDQSLVVLRRVLEEKGDPFSRFDDSVDLVSTTIEHLEAVLAQMLKLETVNEALQMLRDIIKAQEELQEKTRQERKKKLIEGLQ
ncbi:MAG: hypothetical protein JSS02_31990 [Planctomycetes bacterium]|nr:hypothetical protein [Planctomycetota bacterium]